MYKTMKKIYKTPEIDVMQIAPATLIAESLPSGVGTELDEDDILVKGQVGGRGGSSVWDDDWSK